MSIIIYLNKVKLDSNLPAVNFSLGNAYGLAQVGVDCHLILQKSNSGEEKSLLESFNLKPLDNFHLHIYPEIRRLGIKTNQWFYLKAMNYIKRLNRLQKIQAVISRDPGALPYLSRMKKKNGIPIFYQPHNFYADLTIRPDVEPKNAKKYNWLESKYILNMTGLLCLQDSQAEWYKRYFPHQNIFVSKPGLLSIHHSNLNRFANKVIGYVGSLKLIKGVDLLLNAMTILSQSGFKLLIVGGRNFEEIRRVEQRIDDLQVKDCVEITGWMPYSKVVTYLDKISVGVIPLIDNFYNRYLTAPNKLFDYLSWGIPIVASDLPSIGDFLKDDCEGILFEPEKEADYIAAIRKLFSSSNYYEKLQRNSYVAAEKYLWSTCAENMLKQIESVAKP